jgi:hypothetical protein
MGAFTATLGTDQASYTVGQPVTFTYTQANTSGSLAFASNGPSINGFVVTQNGTTVWQSNAGVQPGVIWTMMVLPNGSISLTATWDGHSADGGTPTGTFQVYNQLDQTLLDTFTIAPTVPTVRTPPPPATPPLAVTVAPSQASTRAGQPVVITVTETNKGTTPQSVLTGARILTATVTGPHGQVWVYHDLRAIATGRGLLQPGHSRSYSLFWNGQPNVAGASVVPGTYTIRVTLDGVTSTAVVKVTR